MGKGNGRPVLGRLSVAAVLAGLSVPLGAWAAALTPGNLLVDTGSFVSPADRVYEMTLQGSVVQSFSVPYPVTPRDQYIRDMAVDANGNVHVYNGTFEPYLTTLDPRTGAYDHHQGVGFATASVLSSGGVAAFGRYVYVSCDLDNDDAGTGIVRFDTADYSSQRFQSGTHYTRVALGADGLLYALCPNQGQGYPGVDVFDPVSMALARSVTFATDIRAVAATANGDIFGAGWDGKVYHYGANGTLLNSRATGFTNLCDIDLSPTGQLALSHWGHVILTDTTLASTTSFAVNGPVFVAFTSPLPAPEPGSASLCLMGALAMLTRRRR